MRPTDRPLRPRLRRWRRTLLLSFGVILAAAARADDLVIWHTQDGRQAELIGSIIGDFAKAHHIKVRLESGVDLRTALLTQVSSGKSLPDAIFAPSDSVGMRDDLALSPIPSELLTQLAPAAVNAVTLADRAYGVPILQGNQILLYYDRQRVKTPATSWDELAAQKLPVAIESANAYIFLAFLASFDGWPLTPSAVTLDTTACRAALRFLKKQIDRGVAAPNCGYDCVTRRFYAGDFAYALNGDWALEDARKALGARLGVAGLPKIGKKAMVGVSGAHALMFPSKGLSGTRKELLAGLSRHMLSVEVQRRWLTEGKRTPARLGLDDALDDVQRLAADERLRSRAMPNDPRMPLVWIAMGKGLRLFINGALDADKATRHMQQLAAEVATPPANMR